MQKIILVTGANGQLGSEIKEMSENYSEFNFIFSDFDTLDITDEKAVVDFFTNTKPNYVINCAAYTAVDKAESDIDKAIFINDTGLFNLNHASVINNAKLINVSTDYVFDGTANKPYTEDHPTNPVTIYGKTKLMGENHLIGNNNALTIRTSWLYSSFGNNFVKTILRLAHTNPELNVVNDQQGTPCYARDLADAIMHIIDNCEKEITKFTPGIYHYSNLGVCTWFDFAKEILRLKNIDTPIKPCSSDFFKQAAKRPTYSVLDKSKIISTYKLEIPNWEDSLSKCLTLLN